MFKSLFMFLFSAFQTLLYTRVTCTYIMLNVDSDARGLRQGLRICIFIKLPAGAEVGGPCISSWISCPIWNVNVLYIFDSFSKYIVSGNFFFFLYLKVPWNRELVHSLVVMMVFSYQGEKKCFVIQERTWKSLLIDGQERLVRSNMAGEDGKI